MSRAGLVIQTTLRGKFPILHSEEKGFEETQKFDQVLVWRIEKLIHRDKPFSTSTLLIKKF